MQTPSLNANQRVIARGRIVSQEISTNSTNSYLENRYNNNFSTDILVFFCVVSSLLFVGLWVTHYRKHRAKVHQQRVLMLERLWRISPQKQS